MQEIGTDAILKQWYQGIAKITIALYGLRCVVHEQQWQFKVLSYFILRRVYSCVLFKTNNITSHDTRLVFHVCDIFLCAISKIKTMSKLGIIRFFKINTQKHGIYLHLQISSNNFSVNRIEILPFSLLCAKKWLPGDLLEKSGTVLRVTHWMQSIAESDEDLISFDSIWQK